jgi:hypothetical protein
MVGSPGKRKVTFTWNSTLVTNGPHSLEIEGFPKQGPANSSDNITVNVQNQQSSSSPSPSPANFATLPASSALPTESSCAQTIGFETEMVPDKQTPKIQLPLVHNSPPTRQTATPRLHYSGNWFDGDPNSGAIGYIGNVQNAFAQKSWRTRWPAVNWPD